MPIALFSSSLRLVKFNKKWMGRKDPILWPPRSPYLTIMGRFRQMVYEESLDNNEEQLKGRIINAI